MENTYSKIKREATALMDKRGYHGTSITMIAEKVGCSKSTIFHHFHSKEGILLSIINEDVSAAINDLTTIAGDESMDGLQKLNKFIRHHLHAVAEKGDVIKLYLRESRFLSEDSAKIHKNTQRTYADLAVEIIKRVQKEQGQIFQKLNPRVVAYAILSMCNGVDSWYDKKGELSIDEIAEHFSQICCISIKNTNSKQF